MDIKKQMEISAFMCSQWNNINSRIQEKKRSIKPPININALALKQAEAEYNKQSNSFKSNFFEFLKNGLLLFVLPCFPVIIALLLFFYFHIEDKNILKFCFGAAFIIFILNLIIVRLYNKRKSANRIDKLKNKYLSQLEQKNNKIEKENRLLRTEIQELQRRKSVLEEKMFDECLIHKDYWCVGPQLYYLIDCGRADSVKEAINLFEHIKEEEARKVREEALAAEIRWNNIVAEQHHEEIMREVKAHNDMIELATFAAYIDSK